MYKKLNLMNGVGFSCRAENKVTARFERAFTLSKFEL
jgi:hypothetical protein